MSADEHVARIEVGCSSNSILFSLVGLLKHVFVL